MSLSSAQPQRHRQGHWPFIYYTYVTSVDGSPSCRNAGDVDDSTPLLLLHMSHCQLREDETGPKVHVDSIVPLGYVYVEYIGDTFPIASIQYGYVRALSMLHLDLLEQSGQVTIRGLQLSVQNTSDTVGMIPCWPDDY